MERPPHHHKKAQAKHTTGDVVGDASGPQFASSQSSLPLFQFSRKQERKKERKKTKTPEL